MSKYPIKNYIPIEDRPKCIVPGCENTGQHSGNYKKNGDPIIRKMCGYHLSKKIAAKHGLDNITEVIAKKAGFYSVADYNNSRHRYRKNRKDYCENNNGMGIWIDPDTGEQRRLHEVGVTCTATITHAAMLSVDHINGENTDDSEGNHQTLCHNCHKVKSILSKDHWSSEKKRLHLEKLGLPKNNG